MRKHSLPFLTACALACLTAGAGAHPLMVTPTAEAGAYAKAVIGIPHGCGGTATREVTVLIPPGVTGAKPMVKPGWTVSIERTPLAQPRQRDGRSITEEVSKIRFSGSLPNDQYDEFTVVGTMPEAGTLYWPVIQSCEKGSGEWTQVPAPGQNPADLKNAALRMEIAPAAKTGHHH